MTTSHQPHHIREPGHIDITLGIDFQVVDGHLDVDFGDFIECFGGGVEGEDGDESRA